MMMMMVMMIMIMINLKINQIIQKIVLELNKKIIINIQNVKESS
jgi:hypothetical protein